MTNRTYTSESHRKSSEAAQKAVAETLMHPLSVKQMEEQIDRNRAEILRRGRRFMEKTEELHPQRTGSHRPGSYPENLSK